MKKLNDSQSLEGELEHISVSEFREQPGEVFQQVAMGKVFVLEKNGRVFAQIRPAKPLAFEVDSLKTQKKKAK